MNHAEFLLAFDNRMIKLERVVPYKKGNYGSMTRFVLLLDFYRVWSKNHVESTVKKSKSNMKRVVLKNSIVQGLFEGILIILKTSKNYMFYTSFDRSQSPESKYVITFLNRCILLKI